MKTNKPYDKYPPNRLHELLDDIVDGILDKINSFIYKEKK